MSIIKLPSWDRSLTRIGALVLLAASLTCQITAARAADGVQLSVKKGPAGAEAAVQEVVAATRGPEEPPVAGPSAHSSVTRPASPS